MKTALKAHLEYFGDDGTNLISQFDVYHKFSTIACYHPPSPHYFAPFIHCSFDQLASNGISQKWSHVISRSVLLKYKSQFYFTFFREVKNK